MPLLQKYADFQTTENAVFEPTPQWRMIYPFDHMASSRAFRAFHKEGIKNDVVSYLLPAVSHYIKQKKLYSNLT